MERPIKPQTTDGIAASSSTRIFRNSRVRPVANSPMYMAAPREKGIAISMASPVTLAVPTIKARAPYVGLTSEVGAHLGEVKKVFRLKGWSSDLVIRISLYFPAPSTPITPSTAFSKSSGVLNFFPARSVSASSWSSGIFCFSRRLNTGSLRA